MKISKEVVNELKKSGTIFCVTFTLTSLLFQVVGAKGGDDCET